MNDRVAIVLIGRNEAARLERTLDAALRQAARVVYVDSGSSDNSTALARGRGVPVVALDNALPFTAARARNAGASFWLRRTPAPEFLLFVDGDCELAPGFLEHALPVLDRDSRTGIVCGRRREQSPRASLYTRLAQIEWNAPAGEIEYCGGDALVRASTFRAVGGYDASLIAGEDPEFCIRVRRAGWKIWRIQGEMTRHDAREMRFPGWWKRSVRTGHAYAQGAWRCRHDPEHPWLRETLSIWFWGVGLWSAAFVLARPSRGTSLALLVSYPALLVRIFVRAQRQGLDKPDAALYALFCLLSKFPQLQGQMLYLRSEWSKQPTPLIEY